MLFNSMPYYMEFPPIIDCLKDCFNRFASFVVLVYAWIMLAKSLRRLWSAMGARRREIGAGYMPRPHATWTKHSRQASVLVSAAAQWLSWQTYSTGLAEWFPSIQQSWFISRSFRTFGPLCTALVQTNCRCVGCENVGKVAMTMVSNEIARTACPELGPADCCLLPALALAPPATLLTAPCLAAAVLYLLLSRAVCLPASLPAGLVGNSPLLWQVAAPCRHSEP